MTAYRISPPVPASLDTAITRKSTWERRMVHYYRHTRSRRPAVYFIMVLATVTMGLSLVPGNNTCHALGVLCGALASLSWLVIGACVMRYRWWLRGTVRCTPVTMPEWKASAPPKEIAQEPLAMTPEEIEARQLAFQRDTMKWTLMRRLY